MHTTVAVRLPRCPARPPQWWPCGALLRGDDKSSFPPSTSERALELQHHEQPDVRLLMNPGRRRGDSDMAVEVTDLERLAVLLGPV